MKFHSYLIYLSWHSSHITGYFIFCIQKTWVSHSEPHELDPGLKVQIHRWATCRLWANLRQIDTRSTSYVYKKILENHDSQRDLETNTSTLASSMLLGNLAPWSASTSAGTLVTKYRLRIYTHRAIVLRVNFSPHTWPLLLIANQKITTIKYNTVKQIFYHIRIMHISVYDTQSIVWPFI